MVDITPPAMKRNNDRGQMRREEVEALDDQEEEAAGEFRRASTEVLAKRKIYKINRTSFEVNSSDNKPLFNTALFPTPTGLTLTQPSNITTSTKTQSISVETDNNNALYKEKMAKLNKSFLDWFEKQCSQNPTGVFTDAVEGYIKYCHELAVKYDSEGTVESVSVGVPNKSLKIIQTEAANHSNIKPTQPEHLKPNPFASVTLKPQESAPITESGKPNPFANITLKAASSTPAAPVTSMSATPLVAPSAFTGFSLKPTAVAPTSIIPSVAPTPAPAPTTAAFTVPIAPSTVSTATTANPAFSFMVTNAASPSAHVSAFTGFSFAKPAGSVSKDGTTSAAKPLFQFNTTFPALSTAAAPLTGQSSLSAASVPAIIPTGGENEDGDGEGEEIPILAPTVILRNEDDKDEQLYEVRCKLFRLNNETKEWGDLGKGALRITRSPDSGKERILVRNEVGKPLVNAYFFKDMKFEVMKNGIKFFAFVAEDSGFKGIRNFLVKVNADKLDETVALLRKYAAVCS